VSGVADVDAVIAGAQKPMYFTQMVAIYDRWFVRGFRYNIRIINRSNNADINPIMVNVQVRDTNTMDANTAVAAQRWYDKDYQCQQGLTVIKGYVKVGQPFGYSSKRAFGDESFFGAGTSNPTNQAYLHILLSNPFSTVTPYVIRCETTWDVHFLELTNIAAS